MNLLFILGSFLNVASSRPLLVYDYLLIPFLILFRLPRLLIWGYFIFVVLLDILNHLAFVYMFSVAELIDGLAYSELFDFSTVHYFLFLIFLCVALGIWWLLPKLEPNNAWKRPAVIFFLSLAIVSYALDTLNGRTKLNQKTILHLSDKNMAISHIRDLAIVIKDMSSIGAPPILFKGKSVTFKTFAADSAGNQLLALVESWGLPVDSTILVKMNHLISEKAKSTNWQIELGHTYFSGSTTDAELRELVSAKGNYQFFLNESASSKIQSIFKIKKKQGYTNLALHSFSNKMFQRGIWWRNIGADSVYFMENVARTNPLLNKIDYYSPFPSLRDEEAFVFLNSIEVPNKKFGYFLSVNTHLPFSLGLQPDEIVIASNDENLSSEAENQLNRIMQIIYFLIEEAARGEWETVLVMGDHMPPFQRIADRNFYNGERVPYFILHRQY